MGDTVVKLGKFATVPTIGGTYKVTCDTLQLVDVVTTTLRTNGQVGIGILVAAVQAAVAVVVDRAIAHVVLIHHIYHAGDN